MTSLRDFSFSETAKSSLTIFFNKPPVLDELDGGVAIDVRTALSAIGEGLVSAGGVGRSINSSNDPGVLETEGEDFTGVVDVGNCRGTNSGASLRRRLSLFHVGTEKG